MSPTTDPSLLDASLVMTDQPIAGLTIRPLDLGSFMLLRRFGNTLFDAALAGDPETIGDLDVMDPAIMRDISCIIYAHAADPDILRPYFHDRDSAAKFEDAAAYFCRAIRFGDLGQIVSYIFATARASGMADVEPVPEDTPDSDPNSGGRSGRPSS